ncbi:MAG TPA: hypothetical protein VGU24_21975 [Microvirga sp.]|jgi:sirohydrochlorin ferrochelatase|nr:hypothetical protein [Microvirga sp.]
MRRAPLAIALMITLAVAMVASLARVEQAAGLMEQARQALETAADALRRGVEGL